MRTLNFKSGKAYKKWLAYGHMHTKKGLMVRAKAGRKNLFAATPGHSKICIHGKPHRVMHK